MDLLAREINSSSNSASRGSTRGRSNSSRAVGGEDRGTCCVLREGGEGWRDFGLGLMEGGGGKGVKARPGGRTVA